jgi:hypothetical protein
MRRDRGHILPAQPRRDKANEGFRPQVCLVTVKLHVMAPVLALVGLGATISACAESPRKTTVSDTRPASMPAASSQGPRVSTAPSGSTSRLDPLGSLSVDGLVVVDDSGRRIALRCWGNGNPSVFLEAGGGAIDEFAGSKLVQRIATETRVCLYNRAGITPSDPAPNRAREAEDVATDFHALLAAAGIAPPVILFGRSFGGMIVTFHAATYPTDVAGVVVFDSPAPNATMTVADFPEGVWDYPDNVERLNVLTGFENRFGKTPVHVDAPLILISTTAGESPPENRYWLQTSPRSKQIVLQGGMDVIDLHADQIADAILSLVRGTATF